MNAWVKTQSPAVQGLIYAVETGVATALTIFLASVYGALSGPNGLDGFNWHAQIYTLEMGVGAAVVKAVMDFLKGANQPVPPPPPPATPGAN